MKSGVRVQLSAMMFLQYFIWGTWYVTMATYLTALNFKGGDIGKAYSATAWAAIVSPFFVGMIADKFFSTQYVLGVMHILSGLTLYRASTITTPNEFFWALILHTLCFMPTLALTNSLSFRQMDDPGRQFPLIRVFGTIGWIIAGLSLILFKVNESTSVPMKIAAGVSLVMGLYCFFLPKTPPQGAGKKVTVSDLLGLDSLRLMKSPSFAIFVISSLLICIPLSFYYNFTNLFLNEAGMEKAVGKMTMGQMSEIFFMVVMPLFFVRLGVKWMLVVGMLAWTLRYVLFAYGNTQEAVWMLYAGIILHGICYDFFFVTGQIYVDKKAPADLRASAQGFITLVTLGLGMLIGAYVSGEVVEKYQIMEGAKVTGHLWRSIWLIPAAMAGVVMVLFALLFRDKLEASPNDIPKIQ